MSAARSSAARSRSRRRRARRGTRSPITGSCSAGSWHARSARSRGAAAAAGHAWCKATRRARSEGRAPRSRSPTIRPARVLAKSGVARAPATTPRELAARLAETRHAAAADVGELVELYYAVRVGTTRRRRRRGARAAARRHDPKHRAASGRASSQRGVTPDRRGHSHDPAKLAPMSARSPVGCPADPRVIRTIVVEPWRPYPCRERTPMRSVSFRAALTVMVIGATSVTAHADTGSLPNGAALQFYQEFLFEVLNPATHGGVDPAQPLKPPNSLWTYFNLAHCQCDEPANPHGRYDGHRRRRSRPSRDAVRLEAVAESPGHRRPFTCRSRSGSARAATPMRRPASCSAASSTTLASPISTRCIHRAARRSSICSIS